MRKKLLIALILISAIASQSASAAYVKDKKPDSNKLTISGTVEEAKVNRLLNVVVTTADYDMNNYPNGVLYSAVIDTGKNGEFEREITLNTDALSDSEHDFKVYISAFGSSERSEENFTYYSAEVVKSVLAKIAADTSAQEVKADIENNLELLNITTELFLSLSAADKDIVYGEIAKETEFSNVSDFENKFYSCVFARSLANANDAQSVKKAFDELSKYTSISGLAIYSEFEKLSDKTPFHKRMCGADVKNDAEICSEFTVQTVLSALESAANADEAKKLLQSGGNIFSDIYSKIENCKYPGSVYTELVGKTYADLTIFKKGVDELIQKYGTGSTGGNSSSGGGSGSSGGGSKDRTGGVTTSANIVTPDGIGSDNNKSEIFSDLGDAEWAKESIKAMYEKKIVSGYPDGTFKPNNPITREEFIALIVSAYSVVDGENAGFSDVPDGAWYEKAVNAAAACGIVSGMGDGVFGVGRNITREEAAAIIKRTADKFGISLDEAENVSFTDYDDISEFAKEAALGLGNAKIISGYPDGGFHPKDLLTRAQCCVILKNMSEKGVSNG